MTCQQSSYDAYFDSGNKVLSSRNEGSCILITAWLEFLDRHERVNIYQYFILSSIFKTSEFGLVSTCAGQCHQESEGWEPGALLAESVVYPTTHIVPMALMDCAFSSKPYTPISMARKVVARRADHCEESGEGQHGFFFNKRVDGIDRKRGWQRQSKAHRRLMEFSTSISSRVDGNGNFVQRPTCLQKL